MNQIIEEQIEKSKIPRIPYKQILGVSLSRFILDHKYQTDEELLHHILLKIKENGFNVISWEKIVENVRISISARRAEQKLYDRL